ncbi:MAG: pseudaminic acid cytidylyltransferase [Clostridia bacterium]|nr:pseudaminic acid cytidylyltransferase [Clostridia bacterium]
MKRLAIITARGGSKRIPKKNIKPFLGKPIIAYSIEAALQSGMFSEVMVSTDSEEIAAVAREYGASVPFMRSEKTSNDFATTADVLEEVLSEYEKRGQHFDAFCCLYPTAPFVTAQKLRDAAEIMEKKGAGVVFPIVKFSYPPQRAVAVRGDQLCFVYPEHMNTRSQDLEPWYHDCGQFYFHKLETFRKYHTAVTPETVPLIVSEEVVQDIDTEADWNIAEQKYKTFILGE